MNPDIASNINLVSSDHVAGSIAKRRPRIEVGHLVQFYENEQFLSAAVSDFLADGLTNGQKLVVVATEEHCAAFATRLNAKGIDVERARRVGDLTMLDARQTLRMFMVGAMPDRRRFIEAMAAVIDNCRRADRLVGVRIYGEMVDVLWKDGNTEGALQLEELWNELSTIYAFKLLCAYSMGNFYKAADAETFREVCRQHTHVVPAESYTLADEEGRGLEISRLQQRARALETEILHRREIEERLRDAIVAARRAEEALRESQRELTDFFENAAIAMHWAASDGTILRANDAELELLGFSRSEYVGRNIAEFHVDPRVVEDILARLGRGETLSSYETRLRCRNGAIKVVLIDSNVYWGVTGEFVHTRCFTRDITDRKSGDEARARLAAIIASSDDAIVGKTLDGTITSWNPGAERIFGYTAAEAVGRHISLIVPADRRAEEDDVLARLGRGERVEHFETVRQTKDGRRIDISLTVSPIRDGAGHIIGASKVARDITAQRRAEEALRLRTAQFETLVNEAPLGVFLVDGDFRIRQVNPIARPFFGNVPNLLGRDFGEVIHVLWSDEDADEILRLFRHTLRTGDPYHTPERVEKRRDTGVTEYHEWQINRITLPEGGYGIVCYLREISTQVQARMIIEDARQQALEAKAAAEAANRAKADFLASMSHELRTPLNAIAGYVQLVEMGVHGPVTDAQRDALRRIEKSEEYLLSLINDVLNFAKLEAGKVEYDIEDVLLADAVAEVSQIMEQQLTAKGLRYDAAVESPIVVRADSEKLKQILLNLLSNAAKFTQTGGHVTVRARADGDRKHAVVVVADTGPGIPPEKRQAVFDPFVQLQYGRAARSQGTGLGLSISRDLARGMGGSLSVDPARTPGAAFLLTLPMAR